MDDHVETIYLRELISQCEWGLAAVDAFNRALEAHSNKALFHEAHSLLQHAASVSRLLWPPGKTTRAVARGDALRKSLSLTTATDALKARTLRDHFEHYDERIDDWAETSVNKNIVIDMIGQRSAIGGNGITDRDIMRAYDPSTKQLWFRGERFDVQKIVDAIIEARRLADARLVAIDTARMTTIAETMANRRSPPSG